MAICRNLRYESDAEVLSDGDETPHLGFGHPALGPTPPRVLFASVHAPRLEYRVVELQQGRKAQCAFDLLLAHLGEPAQVHAAEREVRRVGDGERRQQIPFRLEGSALRNHQLPDGIRRPPDACKRPRRDLHASAVNLYRICLIAGRDALLRVLFGRAGARPSHHLRRGLAVPLGEMRREPACRRFVGAVHDDRGGRVERDGAVHVALELDRHRQRGELYRVRVRLVAGKQRHRQGENRQADECRM